MSNKLVRYKDVCTALIPMIADMMQKGDIEPAIDTLKALGALEDVDPAKVLQEYCDTQPERKKGKWIYDGDCYICDQCKSAFGWWADSQTSNYCPNCGADMRGEQDE